MDPDSQHLYARGIFVGALLVAVLANLASFPSIEAATDATYRAINRYPTASPAELAAQHSTTVRERFDLYAQLRIWAPDAIIFLAPGTGLLREQLVGIGKAGEVITWDGERDLSATEVARIAANTVAEGEDRNAGEFVIAVIARDVARVVSLTQGNRLLLVDDRLLDEFSP